MINQRFAVSVHIMMAVAYLERNGSEGRVNSEELASSVKTNAAVVRRLVARLAEAGLLNSYKGKSGGVELARPARSISLKDIFQADPTNRLLKTVDKTPKKQCQVSCSMNHIMATISEGIETSCLSYLEKIKLTDLMDKIKQ